MSERAAFIKSLVRYQVIEMVFELSKIDDEHEKMHRLDNIYHYDFFSSLVQFRLDRCIRVH